MRKQAFGCSKGKRMHRIDRMSRTRPAILCRLVAKNEGEMVAKESLQSCIDLFIGGKRGIGALDECGLKTNTAGVNLEGGAGYAQFAKAEAFVDGPVSRRVVPDERVFDLQSKLVGDFSID